MAARLQTDFYSEAGTKYTVILYDSDFSGSTTDFTATRLELRYTGNEAVRVTPIISSEVNVSILVQDLTIDTFVSDLVGAEDTRFRVKINKDDAFYWGGIVKTDAVSIEDRPIESGYIFNIVATDGLGRLKDEPYNDDDGLPYAQDDNIIGHVFTCLGKIGINDFWGASDPYLVTLNNFVEKQVGWNVNEDPWEYSYVDHRLFYEPDPVEFEYKSCYEVLEAFCSAFCGRFMQSSGSWRFMQPGYQAESGLVVIRSWTKSESLSVVSDNPFNNWDVNVGEVSEVVAGSKDMYKIASGGYQYLPPLNKVIVAYAHNSTSNLVRYDDITSSTTVENVDNNSGNATLAFQCVVQTETDFGPGTFEPHWIKFKIQIEVNGYYISRPKSYNYGSPITGDLEWVTSQAYYEELVYIIDDSDSNYADIGFVTPPIPSSGDLVIQITKGDSYYTGGSIIQSPYTATWSLSNAYLEVFADGNPENQVNTTYYTAENDTTGNKSKLNLTTIIGGNTHPNSYGKIIVSTTGSSLGGSIATLWDYGSVGTSILQQLIADELILGQLSPVEKMVSQTFLGIYEAHKTLVRNSKKYLLMNGVHDMGRETWTGTWFYLTKAGSGTTPGDEEDSIEIIIGPADTNYSAPSNGTPGLAVLDISDDIAIKTQTNPENAVITNIQSPLTKNTEYEEIAIPVYHPGDLFIEGDSVVVKNPYNGEEQSFTTSKIGHDSGNDAVLVDIEAANYSFNSGSFIVPDPLEQQYNISFGRRKFLNFHLVDLDTDFTTSSTYITYNKFFRPPGSDTSNDSTDFVNRLYLRKIHWGIGAIPSGSSSIQYTARLVRGSTPDVVASTTILGTDTYKTVDINDGEQLLFDDVYKFQVKKNDTSGLDENQGLTVMLELFNKVFEPNDIYDMWVWLKPDRNITKDGSDGVSTWGDSFSSNDFIQISASSRPIFTEQVSNGYPGLVFDNDFLYINSGIDITASDYAFFIAFNSGTIDATNGNTILSQWDGSSQYEIFEINTSGQLICTIGGVTLTGDTLIENTNYIAALTFDGTNQYLYINGDFSAGNTPTPGGTPAGMRIGKPFSGASGFEGTIYEIIVYDTEIVATRRELVEAYLSKKYNISLE
jgi:hypothetical protein